jgi:FkbM family methyltransferase
MQQAMQDNKDAYFLDIGGNIGMFTLSIAAMGRDTYTVEPFPQNYRMICGSVNQNGFHENTHIYKMAATDTPKNVSIVLSDPGNKGSAHVTDVSSLSSAGKTRTVTTLPVRGVPLDVLSTLHLPKGNNKPVVIKVDVEGSELNVLEGGQEFIKRANIVYLQVELWTDVMKNNPNAKALMHLLANKGLKPYREDYGKYTLLDVDQSHMWKHFKHPKVRYFDVIFTKQPNPSWVLSK